MKGVIEEAERIAASDPKYFIPQQFKNPATPEIHFKTTGPEIWEQTGGKIDVFVSGVGTGGTITGVSRYIKHEKGKQILSVAVEPAELRMSEPRALRSMNRPSTSVWPKD